MGNKFRDRNKSIFSKLGFALSGCMFGLMNDISIVYAIIFSTIASVLAIVFAPSIAFKLIAFILYSTVVVYEFLNTSIETTVDRIGLEYHILSKHAKDVAACVSMINSGVVFLGTILLATYTVIYIRKWKKKNPDKSIKDYINHTFVIRVERDEDAKELKLK